MPNVRFVELGRVGLAALRRGAISGIAVGHNARANVDPAGGMSYAPASLAIFQVGAKGRLGTRDARSRCMMLRILGPSSRSLFSFTAFASALALVVGCGAADADDDTLDQTQSALEASSSNVKTPKVVTRTQCRERGGHVIRRPDAIVKACKKAGYSGDVCRAPNPAYDPEYCMTLPLAGNVGSCAELIDYCVQ